jgi:serine/threonine protein kinase
MGSFPGHFLKRTLGRLFAGKEYPNGNQYALQSEQDIIDMNSVELETSGLQEKNTVLNLPHLPDGSTHVQIGSGIITSVIGEGGAAIIYEIKNKQLGLQRAVKLLKPNHTRDTYYRFLREFRISIQLSHPNLAVVHTLGQWNKLPFIEMERISGFSLSEMVAQFGPLPTGLVTSIGIILCKTLEYLNTCNFEIDKKQYHGLLHLDLKPSNVLLSDSGTLKLMDFGLSTPIEEVHLGNYPKAGIGSSQYIAPELLMNQGVPDARSDIYSLGCILYELVSGVKTFPGPEEESVMQLRASNTYVSLKKLSRSIPSDLLRLIEECLSLKKDNRPLNFETVRKELEHIHQSATRLTPESTIQLYVNQRKHNEPFTLPRPLPGTATIIKTTISVVFLLAVVTLAGLTLWRSLAVDTKTEIPAKPTPDANKNIASLRQNHSGQPGRASHVNRSEDVDFYAPSIPTSEAVLLDSIRLCWSSRKFDIMLSLIKRLPPDLAGSKEVILYRLRALGRGGEELGEILESTEVLDGEYFFHKARFQFYNKEFQKALVNLDKALSLPCEFLDKRTLGREVQLYKARSLTSIFRIDPTSENLKAALDAWDRLSELVSDRPNGIHNKEADRERKNLRAEASWRGIS